MQDLVSSHLITRQCKTEPKTNVIAALIRNKYTFWVKKRAIDWLQTSLLSRDTFYLEYGSNTNWLCHSSVLCLQLAVKRFSVASSMLLVSNTNGRKQWPVNQRPIKLNRQVKGGHFSSNFIIRTCNGIFTMFIICFEFPIYRHCCKCHDHG